MDFIDQLKQHIKRVETLKDNLQTEEATKSGLVMPFFQMLGYDVFNPLEFKPEADASFGAKKNARVDYAIILNGKQVILIECKAVNESLDKHGSQLFHYYVTNEAKFGILTNGIEYRFYTDLDASNIMDKKPFLTVDLLHMRNNQVAQLKRFCKSEFDADTIFNGASELKYVQEFKTRFANELENPSNEFVKLFLHDTYAGQKTQAAVDKFRPILKKALDDYFNECLNDKLQAALNNSNSGGSVSVPQESPAPTPASATAEPVKEAEKPSEEKPESRIVTTQDELEAYFLVKHLLSGVVDFKDISYKDTINYFSIVYKGSSYKQICRLRLNSYSNTLYINTADKQTLTFKLENIYDITKYKDELINSAKRFL